MIGNSETSSWNRYDRQIVIKTPGGVLGFGLGGGARLTSQNLYQYLWVILAVYRIYVSTPSSPFQDINTTNEGNLLHCKYLKAQFCNLYLIFK